MINDDNDPDPIEESDEASTRRRFLQASTIAGVGALAGCVGGGGIGSSSGGSGGNSDNGGSGGSTSGNGSSSGGSGYPSKPITVVVPWSQGGGTDRSTRALTPTWSNVIGGNFAVQNYSGGSTQIGGEQLYNADPNGYNVGMWNLPQMPATWIFQDASYRAGDFEYIGTNHADPTLWIAPKGRPYKDMTEFLDYARDKGGDVTVGLTSAVGNTALSALLTKDTYDLEFQLVNLEGGSSVRKAILAGDVDAAVNQPWAFNPANKGKATGLGTHTEESQSLWPSVPSFDELGLSELPYPEPATVQWKLMLAPSGLQDQYPDRYETLVSTYEEAMMADPYRARAEDLSGLSEIIEYNPPEATRKIVEENVAKMNEYKPLFDQYLSGN
jgi:tripartite-type tricarboxylate transporter receptor subunit TctC